MAATAAGGNKSIQVADNGFSDGVPADSGEAAKNAGHTASGDEEALDEESESMLASDFEIVHFFHEQIVPWAVLYFTGEAIEDDDNFEEGEEGEEEELEGDKEGEGEDDAKVIPKKEPTQPA
ncbi:Nucleosome assembly protein 1-like 4 [Sciurus carolinensis]|uniref:Nucleosome assembly protein 1-like 4 n=1 Tax=Sciurus carolinensis TaxID=30640 RepID=A0AA41N4G7_SCICA|nr:Nucleosome assembly protein 1-like 4 [Sciurus carolinensis]